jgi:CDP-diacylglycerol--glycerol-3-phosphate 3-phosphatidyltransferase
MVLETKRDDSRNVTTRAHTDYAQRPLLIRMLIWIIEVTRITPNALTVGGFIGVLIASALVVAEWWWAAGFAFIGSALVDSLDGTLARYQGTSSRFGAFLDSTLDRAADGLILGAFAVVFAQRDEPVMVGVVVVAMIATFLISYTRARAEGLDIQGADTGLMERPERLVLLGPAIFMGGLETVPETVIVVLAALSIMTVVDRVAVVRRALSDQ